MKHFATTMLTFGIMLAALPSARAADTTCPPSLSPGSTIHGNLIVPTNATCELDDGTVTGNVVVATGATFQSIPDTGQTVTINGNIVGDRCKAIVLDTTEGGGMISVEGNVSIKNCANGRNSGYSGRITISGNFVCANTSSSFGCVAQSGIVQGNLTVDNNSSAIGGPFVVSNRVSGNVDFSGNSSANSPELSGNTIGGNLRCFDNSPAPGDDIFGPNTVSGNKEGQCAGL